MRWEMLEQELTKRGYDHDADLNDRYVATMGAGWVRIGRKPLGERSVVQVMVRVCGEWQLDPREALRLSASIPTGALALVGDELVLHQVIILDFTTLAEIDVVIRHLWAAAKKLRQRIQPRADGWFEAYSA